MEGIACGSIGSGCGREGELILTLILLLLQTSLAIVIVVVPMCLVMAKPQHTIAITVVRREALIITLLIKQRLCWYNI